MLNGGMEIIGRSQGQDKEMDMEAGNIRSRAGKESRLPGECGIWATRTARA